MSIFHLETAAVTIAGAIIFFVIALKMIFPKERGNSTLFGTNEEPFVVSIAVAMIADHRDTSGCQTRKNVIGSIDLDLDFFVLYSLCLIFIYALKKERMEASS